MYLHQGMGGSAVRHQKYYLSIALGIITYFFFEIGHQQHRFSLYPIWFP